jgi:hypothetical protein
MRNACKILVRKSEGERLLGRYRHILEGNIKMDLEEIGMMVWSGLKWLRKVSSAGLL